MMKKRIDVLLTEKGLTRSRTLAGFLIRDGKVHVNGAVVEKPSTPVSEDVTIEIKEQPPYVGRGGLKLAHALEVFNIDVHERVVLDVGASTGGFTDCALQSGAKKVYAVDVGHDQLVPELRHDPRVVAMEGTDIRKAEVPEKVDVAVVDVSFISAKNIISPLAPLLKDGADAVLLIKPQFEVGKGKLGKNGVVRDENLRESIIEPIIKKAEEEKLALVSLTDSPILGGSGNKEYLAHFKMISD